MKSAEITPIRFAKCIGVIEDAPPLRLLQIMAMHELGYSTGVEAGIAAEAIDLLRERHQQLGTLGLSAVLLDRDLAHGQGDEVAEVIRELGGQDVLIVSTTFSDAKIPHQNLHLNKQDPFKMAEQADRAIQEHLKGFSLDALAS